MVHHICPQSKNLTIDSEDAYKIINLTLDTNLLLNALSIQFANLDSSSCIRTLTHPVKQDIYK